MNTAYYNGNIYVERGRFVTAMYVKDGIIEKIGTDRKFWQTFLPTRPKLTWAVKQWCRE